MVQYSHIFVLLYHILNIAINHLYRPTVNQPDDITLAIVVVIIVFAFQTHRDQFSVLVKDEVDDVKTFHHVHFLITQE